MIFFRGVLKLGNMAAGKCAQVSLAVAMGVIAIVIALGGTVSLVGLIVRDWTRDGGPGPWTVTLLACWVANLVLNGVALALRATPDFKALVEG